jgi:hypothetical protein
MFSRAGSLSEKGRKERRGEVSREEKRRRGK